MQKIIIFVAGAITWAILSQYRIAEDFSVVHKSYYEADQYKRGMLYAYDNVVICGASPEQEGMEIARNLGIYSSISDIQCGE